MLGVGAANVSEEHDIAMRLARDVTEKISAVMDVKFAEFSANLTTITNRLDDNSKRITEAENRVSATEDTVSTMERRVAELETTVRVLTDRAEDIENRSRRGNIVILGLRETAEGRQPIPFFESWLPELLGIETKRGTMKLDRAHRTFGQPRNDRPRPVMIKPHNFADKQKIIAAAKKKGQLNYEGCAITIKQDFSAKVKEARRTFNDVCECLIKKEIRFAMRYPASLCLTYKGKDHSFKSAQEARDFVDRMDTV